MQLVKDGPSIPKEVLQKLEDGKLIFFCGAGISYPAGLPSFRDLVSLVYDNLNMEMDPDEKKAFNEYHLDRALGLLENRIGRSLVRESIIKILEIDPASKKLSTHEALLNLAKFSDGQYRLVTTNFDRGFVIVGGSSITVDAAPKLPVPKNHRWGSLVHLHGVIQDGDPEGRNLVVTSADFGAAYLTERWASRFVSELFRRYSVVFVGYSVEDPVVRYMMDALAADRLQGDEQAQKAYVFAPSTARGMEESEREWRTKSVEPILYNKRSEHALLHRTLKAWSALHRDGLAGKEEIVNRYGPIRPVRPYDEAIERVIWALSEPKGHVAKVFATLEPEPPPIEWLDVLDDAGLLCRADSSNPPHDRIPLADDGYRSVCPARLDPVTKNLGVWLASNLDKPQILSWVINKGGCLHPEMRDLIRGKLRQTNLPKALETVWLFLSGEVYSCSCGGEREWFNLRQMITSSPWTPALKHQLLHFLKPRVHFGQPWNVSIRDEGRTVDLDSLRISDLVEIKITFHVGDSVHMLIDDIKEALYSQDILVDLLDGATNSLIETFDLLAVLDGADERRDQSYMHQPSISEHEQNQGYEDWTKLIELIRGSWRAAVDLKPDVARTSIERWKSIRYPLFRRLVFFAITESDFYRPEESLAYLLEEDSWWLWSVETQREVFRLLNSIVPVLDIDSMGLLCHSILMGPPREMFSNSLAEGEYQRTSNRSIWVLLAKIKEFGAVLSPEAKNRFASISNNYSEWQLQAGDRDEFPTWMESGFGYETEYSVDQLRSMETSKLTKVLLKTKKNREGLLDLWREVVRKEPTAGIQVLSLLSAQNDWIEDVWHSALNGFGGEGAYSESWRDLSAVLIEAPDSFLIETARPIAWWLRDVTKSLGDDEERLYWPIWDRLIRIAGSFELGEVRDPVSNAINAPVGLLTESLLDRVWARKPQAGQGFDEVIKPRISKLTTKIGPSYVLARVILASRLQVLFTIDEKWCQKNLMHYFDWSRGVEARFVWKGYLWAARISPDLLAALKKNMLRALIEKDLLGDSARKLCQLFIISSLEFPNAFTHKQMREVLRDIDPKSRAVMSDTLQRRIAEVGKESSLFWINRVEPWLKSYWPKDRIFIDKKTSEAFAIAAIVSGEAFERAVNAISKIIMRVKDPSSVIHHMSVAKVNEQPLTSVYPIGAIHLLDLIISDDPEWPTQDWRAVLDQIVRADYGLIDSIEYRRLDEILRAYDL